MKKKTETKKMELAITGNIGTEEEPKMVTVFLVEREIINGVVTYDEVTHELTNHLELLLSENEGITIAVSQDAFIILNHSALSAQPLLTGGTRTSRKEIFTSIRNREYSVDQALRFMNSKIDLLERRKDDLIRGLERFKEAVANDSEEESVTFGPVSAFGSFCNECDNVVRNMDVASDAVNIASQLGRLFLKS